MRPPAIEPAPRSYSAAVTLMRRAASAPIGVASVETLEAWLLGEASDERDVLRLVHTFGRRLAGAGLGVDRFSLHVGTLHPQAVGFAWNWSRADGLCDEIRVAPAALESDSYRRTPLFRVIEHGERFEGDTGDPELVATYPFLRELAGQGLTRYVAVPLGGGGYHNAVTLGTYGPEGFPEGALPAIERLLALFALHVQRHIALRISAIVADTYLGAAAGRRVLDGSIRRGEGEAIESVIWASDLRGFTDLSERLEPESLLGVLNAYFACMAEAVMQGEGEVLKFIGDGMLAAFPVVRLGGRRAAAAAALDAARSALAELAALNADPPGSLAALEGWRPLATGIGLHAGTVFFGNVGAPERLDFTVIGRAVNVASRIEGLCRPLGRPLLISEVVAEYVDEPLDDLGAHPLKGVGNAVRVFAVKDTGS